MKEFIPHINRIIQQRPHVKEALSEYRDLIALMGGLSPQQPDFPREERLAKRKKEEGFPLFSRDGLPLDLDTSADLFKALLNRAQNTDRPDREGVRKALQKAEQDPAWVQKALQAFLKADDEALSATGADVGVDPAVIRFFSLMALKPSLQALRRVVSAKLDKKGWDQGYCPLCGSEPNMACFEKTGKRHLHCGLCGEEWPYPRLNCPFCRNEEQSELGYFSSEQEEGFRVDFCRKCKRYIKTVDQKAFEQPAPMEVEYMATLHLDILAHEQGFH
jgi:FdhE protein